MRLNHYNISLLVAAHPFGFAFVGLRHLPGQEEDSVGGKFLNASSHIDDEQVVVRIDRDGAGFVELADADAAPPDDFDVVEDFGVDGELLL